MHPEKRHYGTFTPTETGKITNQTPINVNYADSLSSCALQCLKDFVRCVSLAYNSANGSCYFYPNFFFANLTSSPNTTLYVVQPYWSFDWVVIVLVGLYLLLSNQIQNNCQNFIGDVSYTRSRTSTYFFHVKNILFNIFFRCFYISF